jgi:hypothetical protein
VTWEASAVPAIKGGEVVESQVRFTTDDVCTVEAEVGDTASSGRGPDLFEALAAARRELEAHDILLGCNGARRDVHPSAMQRQAGWARRAYVLIMPRTGEKLQVVDIFAAAPDLSLLATVDAQQAWYEQWRESGRAREAHS